MQHVVMYSGGIGSWAAGLRVAERYGTNNMTLLFCDTQMEDEDLYRFLHEGAAIIGVPVTSVQYGQTPWEVFHAQRFLGNSRVDLCSRILKREVRDAWLRAHYSSEDCICYVGMDYCQREATRLATIQKLCTPYTVEAPLFWQPMVDKDLAKLMALKHGLRLPRLYELGFQHNNCGGFCVKGGYAHFAHLYKTLPERYRYHMEQEERLRQSLGKDVSILRSRKGGKVTPVTLRQFAAELDAGHMVAVTNTDQSCNCFG